MTEIVCVDEIWFNDVESMTVMGAGSAIVIDWLMVAGGEKTA
jgi:hypothetical protein